ncbi:unnamed protein product, partial [Dicrocoelium dendriticum]
MDSDTLHRIQSANSVDSTWKGKMAKTPEIPKWLSICTNELITRVKNGQLRTLPSCWSSMTWSAAQLREQRAEYIVELRGEIFIDKISNKSGLNELRCIQKLQYLPTDEVFAILCEFLSNGKTEMCVTLTYPNTGWVIMGPGYLNDNETPNEAHFLKEVRTFMDSLIEEDSMKRNIFATIMAFFADLVQDAVINYRDQPALASLTRYQIAHQFGGILFTIFCGRCKKQIKDKSKSCGYCNIVCELLQKPYSVDLMDRLLRYVPADFWRSVMQTSVQRPTSAISLDSEQLHLDIQHMFLRQKPVLKPRRKNSLPPPRYKASLVSPNIASSAKVSSRDGSLSSPELEHMVHHDTSFASRMPMEGAMIGKDTSGAKRVSRPVRRSKKSAVDKRGTSAHRQTKRVSRKSSYGKPARRSRRPKSPRYSSKG